MKKIGIILAVFGLSIFTVIGQTVVKYGADKTKSYVTYSMSHPMHDWDGTSKDVISVLLFNTETKNIDKVAVSIPVSTFDSQNANRDSHMIEVVEGIKYPAITFSSTLIKSDNSKLTVTGNLTFHSVSKPVTFDAVSKISDTEIEVTGSFSVKMSEYKIENPSLMGIATTDDIGLKFYAVYKVK